MKGILHESLLVNSITSNRRIGHVSLVLVVAVHDVYEKVDGGTNSVEESDGLLSSNDGNVFIERGQRN